MATSTRSASTSQSGRPVDALTTRSYVRAPLPESAHSSDDRPTMLKRLSDMPTGTIGFEAVGEVEDDDWERSVEPQLRQTMAGGGDLRVLYLLGPRTGEVEGDAVRAEAGFHARHPTAYERLAVVTDEEWVRPAMRGLSFLLPGRARAFPVSDLDAAKRWLAEGLPQAA